MATKLKGISGKKQPGNVKTTLGQLNRSSATDDIFSKLAEEETGHGDDTEDSDVSAADPTDIMKYMMDMEGMDAEPLPSKKKPSSAPAQTNPFGKGPKEDSTMLESNAQADRAAERTTGGKKPNSAPSSTAHHYKKFTISDLDDEIDELLRDEDKPESKSNTKQDKLGTSVPSPSASSVPKPQTSKAAKNPGDLTFDDVRFDLMDTLGLDDKNYSKKKETALWSNEERHAPSQRAHTKLHEILESMTSPSLLERPPTGERKDPPLSQEKKHQEKSSDVKEEDFTFGSYQPTLASKPEGRQSCRQFVRFPTEDVSSSTPEIKPEPTTPTSSRHRNSADWLGLKTNDDDPFWDGNAGKTKTSAESPKAPSSPSLERRPSLTASHATYAAAADTPSITDEIAKQIKAEVSKSQRREEENDGWLAGALGRKKVPSASASVSKTSYQEGYSGLGREVDLDFIVSKQVTSQTPAVRADTLTSVRETSNTLSRHPSPVAHSSPVREKRTMQVPQQNGIQNTPSAVQQVTLSADSLQQLLLQQQMIQSQMLGVGAIMDAGVMQRCKERDQQPEDYQTLQARIIQLEGQVKTLQLERDQNQILLENVQQHHKKDMELMENAHKARVKLLEESAAQRDTQAQQECKDLMERLSTVTELAERERSELQDHYQHKLARAQQDRDREVERLGDLQRKSILEMKKDHEDQIQRLKKLKDEEIDAITSATSQTRSLTVAIEQMDQFSSRLGELSSQVESTHLHTAQGLELGARHRDEQLRLMQDRLAQEQKTMEEERAHLKEIISRMDSRLSEQQRQLEKDRWKTIAEQAKAESTQRGLEEERRTLTIQINMEREELERAKSALLEEQKSVMQHCAEERRKLAAEWAQFHTIEKERRERAEREVRSLLEKREGSIISLVQEQADLNLRTAELKQKEMALAQERETLERLREELDCERDRISSSALRVKTKGQEVEAFSKLAAEKYEEGEQALQEAKRVEAKHEARLTNIHMQTERLMLQEQRTLKERMRLSNLQKEAERLREDLSVLVLPQRSSPGVPDAGPLLPNPELPSTMNTTPFPNSEAISLHASLAMWKYNTDKDWVCIEEEQFFLDKLKKKSYKLF